MRLTNLVRVVVLALLAAAACSRRYERPVTPWCIVRVREPVRLGGGMIKAGPEELERVFVARPGFLGLKWVEVSRGNYGWITRLANHAAVIVTPKLGAGALVIRPDGSVRSISTLAPCGMWITISPDGRFVDCGTCTNKALTHCPATELIRHNASGDLVGTTILDLGAQSDYKFRQPGVTWYDRDDKAYLVSVDNSLDYRLLATDTVKSSEFSGSGPGGDAPSFWRAGGWQRACGTAPGPIYQRTRGRTVSELSRKNHPKLILLIPFSKTWASQ